MIIFYLFAAIAALAVCLYLPEIFIVLYYGRNKKAIAKTDLRVANLPMVSIIMPVYNEESLIKSKLSNMLELNYPKELLEMIVVDGNSTDRTADIVREFSKDGVKLIEQKSREGVTEAVKKGVSLSRGDIILMTDAEALFDCNSIRLLAENFEDPSIGGVSGRPVLTNPTNNDITRMEMSYHNFYMRMRASESRMYSTPHFKGELVAVRRSLFPFDMPSNSGALDCGIAFNVIRKGFRAVVDDRVIFHDIPPDSLKDRNRQKIQRGSLLQENFLQNFDMLFNPAFKTFGKVIFPSDFSIYIVFPIVFLAGLILSPFALADFFSYSQLGTYIMLSGLLMLLIIKRSMITIFTFLHSQIVLIAGLLRIAIIGKPQYLKQVEGTRKRQNRWYSQ